MKNAYKVIVQARQGQAQSTTYELAEQGASRGPLTIKALPGARYQLIDNSTGQGPDNIRVKRVGQDLRISFDGREDADLVMSAYYAEPVAGAVIGEVGPGSYHAYIPETGETAAMIGNLTDSARSVGMALGGEPLGVTGAAAAGLAVVAGFNPLWAAPLALLGAGGGSGAESGPVSSGGVAGDVTPPKVTGAQLHAQDDTGFSNSDGITSDNTPRWLIDADADATQVEVSLNGKTYTSTTKNAQGQFVVQVPDADALGNGVHLFSVVVKDAAGNASQPFKSTMTVLTDVTSPEALKFKSLVMKEDTGSLSDDFLTRERALQFTGVVEGFDASLHKFLVQVVQADGGVLSMAYVNPDAEGDWTFDNRALVLGELNKTTPYVLKTSVVDAAGNVLKSTGQSWVVDLEVPVLTYTPGDSSTGTNLGQNFTSISYGASEKGVFSVGGIALNGGSVTLSKNTYATGELALGFTDLAGNAAVMLTNPSPWTVQNLTVALNQGTSAGAFIELAGSVGRHDLNLGVDSLDVSSLYDTRPAVGEKAAINHIRSTGGGNDIITLSMDDVLALGVKNSFTASGHLQMRIDGDASDKVLLDNLMGTSNALHWVLSTSNTLLGGQQYNVYTNTLLGLDVFIQNGMQITAVL